MLKYTESVRDHKPLLKSLLLRIAYNHVASKTRNLLDRSFLWRKQNSFTFNASNGQPHLRNNSWARSYSPKRAAKCAETRLLSSTCYKNMNHFYSIFVINKSNPTLISSNVITIPGWPISRKTLIAKWQQNNNKKNFSINWCFFLLP